MKQTARNQWNSVTLSKNYEDPVVIFSPLTFKGRQPAHIRVQNVQDGSFELQIEEWGYLDGRHLAKQLIILCWRQALTVLQMAGF